MQVADVDIHHPHFPTLTEQDQYEIAFIALDAVLGEYEVMTRLRAIEPVTKARPGMVAMQELPALLRTRLP